MPTVSLSSGTRIASRVRIGDGTEVRRKPQLVPYLESSAEAGEMIATNSRLLDGTPRWLRPGTVPFTDQYLLNQVSPGSDALSEAWVLDRMTGPGFSQQVAGRK